MASEWAREVLGDWYVAKTPSSGVLARLPRYIAEKLIAQEGAEAERIVAEYLPRPEDRQLFLHRLLQAGELTVLDHLEVRVDLPSSSYRGRLAALGEEVFLPFDLAGRHPELLAGGLWGRVRLFHGAPGGDGEPPLGVSEFIPFVARVQVAEFIAKRRHFDLEEWLDLLLRSAGYEPAALGAGVAADVAHRRRLLLVARLLPLVEPNLNLIELGPKNTGKTFLLRNLSPGAFVVSGGKATPANLFVNLATRQLGVVGVKRVLVFDEVAQLRFVDAESTLPILKDYLESGQFSRGRQTYSAEASVLFTGNLEVEGEAPSGRYEHLFQVLPPELREAAILDRLHGFIPGWEIPKVGPDSLSREGLAADLFGEFLLALRHQPYGEAWRRATQDRPYLPHLTRRDQVAIERLGRGLLKLLFPDGVFTPAEADPVLTLAVELRQRVHDQLARLDPGEFFPRRLGYEGLAPAEPRDLVRRLHPRDERLNREAVVGEITALTGTGGEVQIVEVSVLEHGRGELRLTGRHDPGMEHSALAAFNFVRDNAQALGLPTDALKGRTLAAHLVEIGRERDGTAAGLAFLLAFVSALTGRPLRPSLAVTGEASIHGRISRVDGILPKLLAAARHGRSVVLLPAENAPELEVLPTEVRSELEILAVADVPSAIRAAFRLLSPVRRGLLPGEE